LSDDTVTALACDAATGQLAVGYARQGIDLFDAAAGEWRHLDRSSGLASNNVRALALAGQAVWVVADDGITVAAGMDSTFYNSSNSPLESNRVGSIVVDPAGTVWLGGDGVLYAVAGEDWTGWLSPPTGSFGWGTARDASAVLTRRRAAAAQVFFCPTPWTAAHRSCC
jgi:ligand-binding sensor domain-containing protein